MCLCLEPHDVERLEQLCHFTSRSVLIITWFTLPSLSQALSLNHSSSQSLFSTRLIFLWWFPLKRYLCYSLYILKGKENSKEPVWQIIMVDGEWCGNGGEKGKSQGIDDSANANDMLVWMRPHIGFCTIGKCDLLSCFLSTESLPAACKFHPLFLLSFWNMELFIWGFSSFAFQSLLLFLFLSLSFFDDPSFAGLRFHSLDLSRRITW
jgi:hypothetical protein